MTTILLGTGFIALFFIMMSVRLIFVKDGNFKGTCASQSPFLNQDGENCSFCGKSPDQCENKDNPKLEKVNS